MIVRAMYFNKNKTMVRKDYIIKTAIAVLDDVDGGRTVLMRNGSELKLGADAFVVCRRG